MGASRGPIWVVTPTLRNQNDKCKCEENTMQAMEDAYDLCAMISECNLVRNPKKWFLDSGVFCHIFFAKAVFVTYTPTEFDKYFFMGYT